MIRVKAPGLFTTLQDLGRYGAQSQGMPVAGAMDTLGLRIANALCGNAAGVAALELSYMGPTLVVEADAVQFGLAGNMSVELLPADGGNAKKLTSWRSVTLKRGEALRIGVLGEAYTYVAVAGGFDLPPLLGSLSTYTRAGLGGFEGRQLRENDLLPLKAAGLGPDQELSSEAASLYGEGPVRVTLGPQADRFTAAGTAAFLAGEYTVSKEADRMGLRLEGPVIEHLRGADIASEGIVTGAIQVPGNGQPILLLADHQTTGGYTKIATIISADLPRVGRLKPGAKLRFQAVSVAEAENLRRAQEAALKSLLGGMRTARPEGGLDLDALYTANLISGMVDAATGADA
ncbi:biotin-dependent carboxyltransferase family protein [Ferrovibrio sp.]|uniref:5-oxoprolinase subunit C family protein n=1 Tax=Ferrovibrio sp. TaxID=1917215 RepID=UPI003D108B04